jgi:O6-methylguanine-DNA--protein-cysteine methyltransferase
MSEEKIDIRSEIDAAIKKGQYPDRAAAIAGLQKQLVDYQKGAFKDKLKDVQPIKSVEAMRGEVWQELLQKAGGNEDKAAELYLEELKKLKL